MTIPLAMPSGFCRHNLPKKSANAPAPQSYRTLGSSQV